MKTALSIGLLACLANPAIHAQENNQRATESKIIALERVGKLQASEVKDIKTLNTIFDDNFVYVDDQGALLTKGDVLRFVQTADSMHFMTDAMVVKVHGNTAIVTGLYRLKGVMGGKPFLKRGRFVDTWQQENGRWVAIASLSTPIQ